MATGSVFSTMLIESVIARAAPSGTVDLLIDVGSGDSPHRDVIHHRDYVGIDRRPRGRDALLVTADVATLPLRDGADDALLCTEVIEHVSDEHALVALDGVVRWADSLLGRITWRLPMGAGGSIRLRSAISRLVQRQLAILTLRADRNLDPIDPIVPSPRITLGYVVTATHADPSSPHAG